MRASGYVAAAAIERDEAPREERGLAHRALPRGSAVVLLQPLVDAGPAVEVAAEGHHRIGSEVEADVAVKATAARGGSVGGGVSAVLLLCWAFWLHLLLPMATTRSVHRHLKLMVSQSQIYGKLSTTPQGFINVKTLKYSHFC